MGIREGGVDDEEGNEEHPRHHLAGDGALLVSTSPPRLLFPSHSHLPNEIPTSPTSSLIPLLVSSSRHHSSRPKCTQFVNPTVI
ncbi:hypothetical protein QVD17_10093 [Tagetes erecta]|uniref:Uncharacterized protein n=1 Tax=Tagetes erecta TaxID=13708 RepID=A0AAD8P5W4_TARER|nr:hypothetical protein QVD17_10093 [Tagetes erecta]